MSDSLSRVPLNLMDRVQWELHQTLRKVNGCGNILQFAMQWEGQVDRDRLQAGLDRLKTIYPLLTARAIRTRFVAHGWSWSTDPTRELPLQFHSRKEGETVESRLIELIRSCDHPTDSNPIEFHLIELDDQREFLVVQWCHALMDGKAVEFLMRDLDRIMSGDESIEPEPYGDEILERIHRVPFFKRVKLARAMLREGGNIARSTLRGRGSIKSLGQTMVLERREIDLSFGSGGESSRIERLNLSTTLAASGLKAMHDLREDDSPDKGLYQTDIPVNLRSFGKQRPICRNVMSRFRLSCGASDCDDLAELIQKFDGQIRDQVSGQRELASLILLRVAVINNGLIRAALKGFCKKELSLGYANMGQLAPGLRTFQGNPVTSLHSIAMPWTTGTLVMTAHQIGTRLFVSCASIEEIVPRTDVLKFLDQLELNLKAAMNAM